MNHDIIIIGGGISGAVAAIAAARCGSDVLVIDKNASLGGTLAACEVGPMMTFHAGDKLAIRGITNEIIETTVHIKEKELADVRYQLQEQVNQELAKDSSSDNQLTIVNRILYDFSKGS